MEDRKPETEVAGEQGVTRRGFLTATGAVAIGIGCGGPILAALANTALPTDKEGHRWAMVVDTRKCAEQGDCQDCVLACHRTHNVPESDPELKAKEEIKWIWREPYKHAFLGQEQEYMRDGLKDLPIPVLCNHCENPPCVRVCPTQATFKRDDGIVAMDMHRCIGCRYCIVACPYGSRSFNWREPWPRDEDGRAIDTLPNPEYPTRMRGVVEKCNFCAERKLTEGETPACVEACECEALTFGDLNDPGSKVRWLLEDELSQRRRPELGTNPHVFYLV